MKVIGITGGIGSGKTTVVELIAANYNAYIINTDDIAKKLMEPGEDGYKNVVEIFGEEILDEDKKIDRQKLAGIVFSNRNKLMVLNSIIHPMVKKFVMEKTGYLKCSEEFDYVIIESALLIQDHYEVICDEMWFVYAPDEVRAARLKRDRGYSDEKIADIFKNQPGAEEYRLHCKEVINNDDGKDNILAQLKGLLRK